MAKEGWLQVIIASDKSKSLFKVMDTNDCGIFIRATSCFRETVLNFWDAPQKCLKLCKIAPSLPFTRYASFKHIIFFF